MVEVERRKLPRYKIEVDVAVVTRGAVSFEATATEISGGGARIQAAKVILPDTQVAIFMQLQEEIELRGTVKWALDSYEQGKPVYQMGIQTDVIVFPHKKAFDLSEQVELVQEILFQIKSKQATDS
jgi:hypothetical protein